MRNDRHEVCATKICVPGALWSMPATVAGIIGTTRKFLKRLSFQRRNLPPGTIVCLTAGPRDDYIREIGVSCYKLSPSDQNQLSLLEEVNQEVWLSQALDCINQKYGNFTIAYASAYPSHQMVKQKIPFGSTRYFELLCGAA